MDIELTGKFRDHVEYQYGYNSLASFRLQLLSFSFTFHFSNVAMSIFSTLHIYHIKTLLSSPVSNVARFLFLGVY